ncbi:MAG: hypothetical protein LBS99_06360 [Clostridiales bacterium]|nr:hypothetical protein [Clostridiales bacterium]
MKETDFVEVTVEKEKYAKQNVHKGMTGFICLPEKRDNAWLVVFPDYGAKPDIACISIDENDLKPSDCQEPVD